MVDSQKLWELFDKDQRREVFVLLFINGHLLIRQSLNQPPLLVSDLVDPRDESVMDLVQVDLCAVEVDRELTAAKLNFGLIRQFLKENAVLRTKLNYLI